MTNVKSDWSRLESVIRWSRMTINGFGLHIGLPRAENLYQIKAGKNGISRALGVRIVEHFPEISLGWLLTGEGDMFGRCNAAKEVPFFDGDIVRGIVSRAELEPDEMLSVPPIVDCDLAIRSNDEAMRDEIKVGSILFLKKISVESIISGGLYVVVCPNYVILRRVRRIGQGGDEVLSLEPANETYDKIEIHTSQVEAIYRLVGNFRLY